MAQYAFYLDAAACSGCKACQIACQDKHALPAGVLWRRVYEVSGGGWRAEGDAWRQDAFAYNLSIACNHCAQPVCAEVCPTGAMYRRGDGIVLIAAERCVGCHYCEWACPYGAPQYDARAREMTKCTLCADELELGKPPACVAACGLRALDFGAPERLAMSYAFQRTGRRSGFVPAGVLAARSVPLPDPGLTEPALLLRSHPHAERALNGEARVANGEEVRPRAVSKYREASLVAFTLLVQLAVGLFWAWLVLRWTAPSPASARGVLLAVGPILLLGTAASLLHLGRPGRAWRALANLRTSWLSREILLTACFGFGWVVSAVQATAVPERGSWFELVHLGVALVGLALIYVMARVYRLRTTPAWNRARTFAAFLLTALVLGGLASPLLLAPRGVTGTGIMLPAVLFMAAALGASALRLRFYRPARGSL